MYFIDYTKAFSFTDYTKAFSFIDYTKAFDCVDHNKWWKRDGNIIPPYMLPDKPV